MKIVTKAFLRYLPRRRGLSVLQLLGIACGVAAAAGMALSSQAALSSFIQAVEFLKGKATHSLDRPAGPMEETILADLMRDPAVAFFSPVIDRTIRPMFPEGFKNEVQVFVYVLSADQENDADTLGLIAASSSILGP